MTTTTTTEVPTATTTASTTTTTKIATAEPTTEPTKFAVTDGSTPYRTEDDQTTEQIGTKEPEIETSTELRRESTFEATLTSTPEPFSDTTTTTKSTTIDVGHEITSTVFVDTTAPKAVVEEITTTTENPITNQSERVTNEAIGKITEAETTGKPATEKRDKATEAATEAVSTTEPATAQTEKATAAGT